MAEPQVIVDDAESGDIEMPTEDITADEGAGADGNGAPSGLEDIEPTIPERTGFLDYLRSPIVEIVIGSGEDKTTLSAHQALLQQSPFFAGECDKLTTTGSNRIELPDDDLIACSNVLEYLYRGDYFPNLTSGQSLEYDPSIPQPDDDGKALLQHARVYTLAQRFGLPPLASLARKKIHLTQSTAKGEIAYARFVYRETSPDDTGVRRPVASFWATRSHVLRHEAEQEFRRMCLEYPQFGFDVLSLVLDAQEKRSQRVEGSSQASGRKRARMG